MIPNRLPFPIPVRSGPIAPGSVRLLGIAGSDVQLHLRPGGGLPLPTDAAPFGDKLRVTHRREVGSFGGGLVGEVKNLSDIPGRNEDFPPQAGYEPRGQRLVGFAQQHQLRTPSYGSVQLKDSALGAGGKQHAPGVRHQPEDALPFTPPQRLHRVVGKNPVEPSLAANRGKRHRGPNRSGNSRTLALLRGTGRGWRPIRRWVDARTIPSGAGYIRCQRLPHEEGSPARAAQRRRVDVPFLVERESVNLRQVGLIENKTLACGRDAIKQSVRVAPRQQVAVRIKSHADDVGLLGIKEDLALLGTRNAVDLPAVPGPHVEPPSGVERQGPDVFALRIEIDGRGAFRRHPIDFPLGRAADV